MQKKDIDAIWFSDGTRRLRITRRILDELFAFEQRPDGKESGGILLGLVFKDHDEILKLGKPSKRDKRGLFSFIRRKESSQGKIDAAWNKSGGHVVYLGEWHTHPGSDPFPSHQDEKMIQNAVLITQMEIGYLYLLVVGVDKSYWVGRQDRKRLGVMRVEKDRESEV